MAYKTILVHLNDERRAKHLLQQAVALGEVFEAHLIGIHVFPCYHLSPPISLPIGRDIIGTIRKQIHEETGRVNALFEETARGRLVTPEWRAITSDRRDPAVVVVEHARAVDLIIASETDPDWDLHPVLDFPERLAIESGRPVLVVPKAGTVRPFKRILLAWNGRREAARAAFDALPLLVRAEVEVLSIDEGRGEGEPVLTGAAIADALARHGVKVTVTARERGRQSVAEAIGRRADEFDANLVVMGCYGHSRFHEFALGGVTRHTLSAMTRPVLFSH